MSTLEKSQVNLIYQNMLARIEMGLLNNNEGIIDVDNFTSHLKEAIQEKTEMEIPEKVDAFSAVFGMVSERVIREMNRRNGEEWW